MPTVFPTVLWESLGKKSPFPPIPAKPSSLGIRQAQAKGQLKIVHLAKGAILKIETHTEDLEWPKNSAAAAASWGSLDVLGSLRPKSHIRYRAASNP